MSSSNNKCVFLIFAVTISLSLFIHACSGKLSQSMLRKIFECPACSTIQCPQLPYNYDCEPVLEAGVCACCYQCARRVGEQCSLTTGRCSKDLVCLPLPGTLDPYQALLDGTAVCTPINAVL